MERMLARLRHWCGLPAATLLACTLAQYAQMAVAAKSPDITFPLQTDRPIDIKVIDERPEVETVPEAGFKIHYSYTAWGAAGQCKNFATEIGGNALKRKGIASYINLNAGGTPDPSHLLFTFVIKHWFARWPMQPEKDPVLVEGTFDVTLNVSKDGEAIYEKSYKTDGVPQFTTTRGVNLRNVEEHFHFAEKAIGIKGDQVLRQVVDDIMKDLSSNWPEIVAAEKI